MTPANSAHSDTPPHELVEENKILVEGLKNIIDKGMKFDNPASDMIYVARAALEKIGHRADDRQ